MTIFCNSWFYNDNVKYILMFYPKHICSTKKYVGTKYKPSTNETLTPLGATYCVYTPVMYVHCTLYLCSYCTTTYMPHHHQGQKFPTQHIVCTYVVHLPS